MLATLQETWIGRKAWRIQARYLRLMDTVNPVTVRLGRNLQYYETLERVEAGLAHKVKDGDPDFDSVEITTTTNEEVKFVLADGQTTYDRIFTAFAQARTLALPGNATVGTTAAQVLAAATRAKAIFRADDGNAASIGLGPLGVTMANAAVILEPGDTWAEDFSASAEWYAIAGAAGQTLRIMTAA